ncbi:flagellar biosynthesis protein FlhF [uncultured Oxalicibacterium sp.]|uniref:flagellar biosynthesis protein FlhF n=1 Tax=uncultured Oxalicibacterium sp. TaxID=1168540 RepID=UPI0025F482FC|nr:flagellar biosynthesis protein FlhF [uncultured Oxalicibacterium sp.]
MNVRKFTAPTSREAWHLVREALGPDAVILSNRSVPGGTEILALAGEDMAALAAPVVEKSAISAQTLAALSPKRIEQAALSFAPQASSVQVKPAAKSAPSAAQVPSAIASAPAQIATAPAFDRSEFDSMMREIRSMRGMLETQLAELAWTDHQKKQPAKSSVLREMLAAGFSASLSRYMVERMPAAVTHKQGMDWIKSILSKNLTSIGNENEILEKGGVYALVGPTGVGKTTTTAKLAARCVMRHGAGKLALITTDGYRIGGYEQLRIYGKILGVMVHSVKDEADLRIALEELKGKHTILIDTAGVSQRDRMVSEQIAMLAGAGTEVKRLLCLNATSNGETLNEVARAYRGDGLAGCILTKLDEAATIGNALDVAIRQKLNLYYVANGQRVPEDLHVANKAYLIDRAFKLKRETAPFRFSESELPLVMANTARAMNDQTLREVMLG